VGLPAHRRPGLPDAVAAVRSGTGGVPPPGRGVLRLARWLLGVGAPMKTVITSLFALGAVGLAFLAWLSHRDAPEQRSAAAATGQSPGPGTEVASVRVAPRTRERIPRFSD